MIADIKKTAEQKMDQSIEALKADLPRSAPAARTPGCSTTSTSTTTARRADQPGRQRHAADARTISVQPWEKSMGAEIEKAIRESRPRPQSGVAGRPDPRADAAADRGAPQGADQGRAPRRREARKIAVRNLRRDANEHAKKLLKDKRSPRTTSAARTTTCRSSPTAHRRDRPALQAKEAEI